MERQKSGFKFEDLVFSHLNNTIKSDGYTDENDGHIYIGDDCIRMSLKTIKNKGELCLGSMHRIVHDTDPLLMAIGWYTGQNKPHKVSVYYLSNGLAQLFDANINDVDSLISDFSTYMKNTKELNEHSYDDEWNDQREDFMKKYNNLFDAHPIIKPRPKRDHKHQRRLQCAISNRDINNALNPFRIFEADICDCDDDTIMWDDMYSAIDSSVRVSMV